MNTAARLLGISVAIGFAGCSSVNAAETTLRLLHSTPVDLYQAVNSSYQKSHGDMKFQEDPVPSDYDVMTQALLRSAVVGDVPDVVFQGYNRVGVTVQRGLAIPLDKFISGDTDMASQGYSKSSLDMCAVDGKPYGLPFATSAPIVYYNLDLVGKAGHSKDALPTDWNGILELARDIRKLNTDTQGVFLDYANTGNWTFQALLTSFGGQMIDADGRTGFNSDAGRKALQTLSGFRDAGQIDMSTSQALQTFTAGGLGIMIASSSYLPQFEQQAEGHFKLATGAFPMETANARLPAGGNCAMILTKDPSKQKAAWDYIKFVSGPVGQTIVALKSGYIPLNSKAIEDPELLGNFYASHPNYTTAAMQMPILTRFQSFPGDNSIKITTVINDHLAELMRGKATADATMSAMVKDVSALLSK
ncbi:ABC transporter substrate-binding protein [Phyllobacterium sophorae]|uniref:ABC transporter substrate-binding protein n=1 Tax=Phyllobacterium sophorae TaxID=1520277 RepID=A0A2P7AQS8_9HYPH|nr:ABC transporter substrate-binding protein [Phyllobacterium sophorae]PSH56487.1 ABC transporter substrate-binding protein [Phyllobacterium sophorae]